MSELIHDSDKLLQLQELQHAPVVRKAKQTLIRLITRTSRFPVTVAWHGEQTIERSELTEIIEHLISWLDNKGYKLTHRRSDFSQRMMLTVTPK